MRDDGVLFICTLTNTAENGDMPKYELTKNKKYWFEFRTVGVSRAYEAKGVNERVDYLVRIPKDTHIKIGEFCMFGNGEQFRIDNVSHGQETFQRSKQYNSVYYKQPVIAGLEYTELTLYRLDKNYDVAINENQG